MAEPYLGDLKSIIARNCSPHQQVGDITCRHFFSGAAAYVGGQIFMSLTPKGLALKLAEQDRNSLFRRGARALQYFPKAPVKKDYALLPIQHISDFDDLKSLIARSIKFVQA